MPSRRNITVVSRLLALLLCFGAAHDRRVVDRVTVGDERAEREHAYEAAEVATGTIAGRTFRETRAWMRYALTVFDDTEVTIVCTFLGVEAPRTFELLVENQSVGVRSYGSTQLGTVEIRVPLSLTKGQTNILVMLRAVTGPTPALVELRSVQDHNE